MRRLLGRLTFSPPTPDDDSGGSHLPSHAAPRGELPRVSVTRTLPGRLFLLSSALLAVLFIVQQFIELPPLLDLFRRVVSVAALLGLGWMAIVIVMRNRRAFLWRVRRKLILSYVFIGFVPMVLIAAFALTGSMLIYIMLARYAFHKELTTGIVEDVQQVASTLAAEVSRGGEVQQATDRKYSNIALRYPDLSLVILDVPTRNGDDATEASSGPWSHAAAPTSVPAWIVKAGAFSGTLVLQRPSQPKDVQLVIRIAASTPDRRRFVIVDLPLDESVRERLYERSGTRLGAISATGCGGQAADIAEPSVRSVWSVFRETVTFMDCTRWDTGEVGDLAVNIEAPIRELANRLASVPTTRVNVTMGVSWWSLFVNLLVVLGVLFLIIQGSALVMGGVLARSITSAVHELFVGTERVREGDFAHRIRIESNDQLGDLAGSFNRMSESIERLLLVQSEKQRLDDELRVAREIQKSLLPKAPPVMAGVDIADLCEPAREVGGDYYDFFEIGPRQLGVLVADVSGKGTSAALYMAELKGLMLALSHTERSPRALLIALNRLLADHLDNRSFITMTYAVIDFDAGLMTSARAGHTPLIVVSGGESNVIISSGMVLGLRLPGAPERFEQVLEEHTQPLHPGDVVVLYTDGITEAMDEDGELFGDPALARIVAAQQRLDAPGIRERVVRDVRNFVGTAEPHDDMTMVVIKWNGEAA